MYRWNDAQAHASPVPLVGDCFPGRSMVGLDWTDLIWGLVSSHCLTRQEPAAERSTPCTLCPGPIALSPRANLAFPPVGRHNPCLSGAGAAQRCANCPRERRATGRKHLIMRNNNPWHPGCLRMRLPVTNRLYFLTALFSLAVLAKGSVVISEIHYKPADKTSPEEFVEISNHNPAQVNLSGWRFTQGIDYTFPEGTVLEAGGYLVLAEHPATLQAVFSVAALGPYSGRLANDGERLVLRDRQNEIVDAVEYGGEFPWPVGSEDGSSIELIHPDLDNGLGGSWRLSTAEAEQDGAPWEELVFIDHNDRKWRYKKGTSPPAGGAAWREADYSENGDWKTGRTSIGYGDNDDQTLLADMRNNYSTVYLRHLFLVSDPDAVRALQLKLYVDDGCIVWINGREVARRHVAGGAMAHDSTSGVADHEREWELIDLPDSDSFLKKGDNVIAIHVINATQGSSDLSIDAVLLVPPRPPTTASPTPGERNSVFATNPPPQIRQVITAPWQPAAGQPFQVTAKITDPNGVAAVQLHYQAVAPGSYLPAYLPLSHSRLLSDADQSLPVNPEFETAENWRTLPMRDNGREGDTAAGDGVYSVRVPAQENRTLFRYRITASDGMVSVRVPHPDDPSLNFAAFVYDGVPAYKPTKRTVHPDGLGHSYPTQIMNALPVYTLITRKRDFDQCNAYSSAYQIPKSKADARSKFNWEGAFVYDGVVHDHIRYRLRQANDRYGGGGKRSMRFRFNRGHYLRAKDNYGREYPAKWRTLNTGKMFDNKRVGNFGLTESANSLLWNLVGVPAPHTHFFHFRALTNTTETPSNPNGQYTGDFWGMHLAMEDYDARFLETHQLEDGNLYKLKDGIFDGNKIKRNQGRHAVTDDRDFQNIRQQLRPTRSVDWLRSHVNWDLWYRYHTICEAIRHYDYWPRDSHSKNRAWYFEPSTETPLGRLAVLPWDADASWGPNWGQGIDYPKNAINSGNATAAFRQEYRNFIREFRDLVWREDVLNPVIDHMAALIGEISMADRDRWRSAPNGRDFGAMKTKVRDMKNFAFRGWSGSTGPTVPSGGRAAYLDQLANAEGDSTRIPHTPVVAYKGPDGHPVNALFFESSPFANRQNADTFASIRWRIAEMDADYDPAARPARLPLFEWRAAWDSGELAEFAQRVHVPPSAMEPGKTYRVRARFKDNTGRTSHWSAPVEFAPSAPSIQPLWDALRITEIMYHPAGNPDAEFIELQNIGWSSLTLADLRLAGGVTYDFATAGIGQLVAGQRLVIAKNPGLIRAIPGGRQATVLGPWNGKLSNNGEAIRLETAWGETVFSVAYKGSWHRQTDGQGLSLVLRNPHSATAAWSSKSGWMPSLFPGGSPGRGDNELATLEPPLWINEIMSGDDGWIELFNPAGQEVNIGGWFLSDTPTRLAKFRLPTSLTIPPGGFLLLEAKWHYGRADASDRFEIPPLGGSLFLSQINSGYLTGLGAMASFGPFEGSASLGLKQTEENNGIMVSLPIPTPGKPNTSRADSDSDGLPDDWELAHGLKPESGGDASGDPDRDGLTNLQEYICGTDPQKQASRLELAMVRDNVQLELRFQAQPNRTYVIESCEHLGLGGWNTVRTLAPKASSGEVVVRELIEKAQPERYFRLLVMP